jgi:hypothetical protein
MGPSNHRARFGSAVTSQHDTTLQVADGLPINVPVFGNPHGRIVAVSRIGPLWPAGDTGESRAFMTMWLVVAATESRDCGRSLQQALRPTDPTFPKTFLFGTNQTLAIWMSAQNLQL